MNPNLSIVQPLLLQAGLTFVLMFWMAKERLAAVRAGTVIRNDPGVRPTWPGRAGTISNAFHNQLEMPMSVFCGRDPRDPDGLGRLSHDGTGLGLRHSAYHPRRDLHDLR